MTDSTVHVERVLAFVDRTVTYGVPVRVAEKRAERRFGVPRALVHAFYTAREGAAR
jgi:hypothetical protein